MSRRKELITEEVNLMVIWDEPREDIFQKLSVNGFEGEEAEEIYQAARNERIASIRSDSFREFGIGLFWLVGSLASFYMLLISSGGGTTRNIFLICWVIAAIGLWKTCKGLVGVIMAPSRRGSLADTD